MEIHLTARHYELPSDLKRHLTSKLQKLDRYRVRIPEVHVTLWQEKYRQIAELVAHVNRSQVSLSEESDDMYRSVDKVLEKLERKLRTHKEKSNRNKARAGPASRGRRS